MIERFRVHLESTETPRTVLAYMGDVLRFEEFRSGRETSIDLYEEWVGSLSVRPQTVSKKRAGVNRWLAFLARHGDDQAARTLAILQGGYQVGREVRQADVTIVGAVTEAEYLAAAAKAPEWGRAIMGLLWFTGARISEVVGDSVSGIPALTARQGQELVSVGYITTLGKGGKVRTIVMPTAGRRALATWAARSGDGAPLFPSPVQPSRSVTARGVNAMLHHAGLRHSAHAFRHAVKERLRLAGVDLEVRMALMGHGPEDAHQRYGPARVEEMLRAAERLT